MTKLLEVEWTKRSLRNAKNIRTYLSSEFTSTEVQKFEDLLKEFEKNVSRFPNLYPRSKKIPELRRAVLHKYTSVFYSVTSNKIFVVALQDNRQENPGK